MVHFGRGIVGLYLNRDLPKSHQVVEVISNALKDPQSTDAGGEEGLTFETFRYRATQQMRHVFIILVK